MCFGVVVWRHWCGSSAGSTQISIDDPKWGHTKIAMWEQNRKRAQGAGAKLTKNIQDLECLLKEMKESVSTVTSPEVLYEAAQRVNSLCTLSYDVFSEFNQWRAFQLNEAELMVFKPAQLVESTVSCCLTQFRPGVLMKPCRVVVSSEIRSKLLLSGGTHRYTDTRGRMFRYLVSHCDSD